MAACMMLVAAARGSDTSAAPAETVSADGTSPTTVEDAATAPDTSRSEGTSPADDASAAQSALARFQVAPEELPPFPPISGEIPEDQTVFLITTAGDTDQLIAEGMTAAADILGWSVQVTNTNRHDPQQATAALMSALESGADAIVVPSVEAAVIADGIAAANDLGVPIVQIGSNEPDEFTAAVNTITANAEQYGQMMAAATVADAERAGTTAHVGILRSGVLTFLVPVFDAFIEHLERYCADCTAEFIDAPLPEMTSGQSSNSIVSALQRNPQLNYVLTLGPFAAGVRPGLDSNGFEDVKIVGYLPTPVLLQEMVDSPTGYVGWVVVPNQYDGFAAMDAVVRAVAGDDPTVHNDALEPLWILLPDSEFDPSSLPELPFDYAEAFSALWGVSS